MKAPYFSIHVDHQMKLAQFIKVETIKINHWFKIKLTLRTSFLHDPHISQTFPRKSVDLIAIFPEETLFISLKMYLKTQVYQINIFHKRTL